MTRAVLFVLVIAMAVMYSYQQDITPTPGAGEGGDTELGAGVPPKRCLRRNEVYNRCGTCEPTCKNQQPVCTAVCRRGCQCRAGFFRRSDRACVRRWDCPLEN